MSSSWSSRSSLIRLGYCSVNTETHAIDPTLPVCPAFAEIGTRLGPFSLGLIPIGAYAPRVRMSPLHNAPIDAVRMFKDVVSSAPPLSLLNFIPDSVEMSGGCSNARRRSRCTGAHGGWRTIRWVSPR